MPITINVVEVDLKDVTVQALLAKMSGDMKESDEGECGNCGSCGCSECGCGNCSGAGQCGSCKGL
jgi:hypothetical protein